MNARTHHYETEEQAAVAWNTRSLRVLASETAAERDRLKVVNEQLVEVLEMAAEHCAMFVRPTNEEEALAENIRAALVEARKP
ncbi:hypothetical protein LCGC14_2742850 [marine sediment metagenome]|uniref:Uncharacterized protein n=1 Tax=marine sediment metagenome TaxID=412755 RepID=A0A0F9BCW3_9ZZZZ